MKKITLEEAKELLAKAKKWTEENKDKESNPFLKELLESKIGESEKTAYEDLIETIKDAIPTEKKTMKMKTLGWVGFGIVTATTAWFCKDMFKQ